MATIEQQLVSLTAKIEQLAKEQTLHSDWVMSIGVLGGGLVALFLWLLVLTCVYTFNRLKKTHKRSMQALTRTNPNFNSGFGNDNGGYDGMDPLEKYKMRRAQIRDMEVRPDQGYGRSGDFHSPPASNYGRNPMNPGAHQNPMNPGAHQNPNFINELKRTSSMLQQGRQQESVSPLFMDSHNRNNRNGNKNMDMFTY